LKIGKSAIAVKTFDVRTFASDGKLAKTAAESWLQLLSPDKPHCVALSGGRIAKSFYDQIVTLAQNRRNVLAAVEFFWADERCVPPTDPESNYFLADRHLFTPLHINSCRIHRLKGELAPDKAVDDAITEINRFSPRGNNNELLLDLIVLGMGEDGHVASLFPNTPDSITATTAPYLHVANSPKPPPNRLSLSYATIAAAKQVWVLASGAGKQQALKESLSTGGSTPLARVLQSRKSTDIFTDVNVA
jgi:6-phosphogluconolactonase